MSLSLVFFSFLFLFFSFPDTLCWEEGGGSGETRGEIRDESGWVYTT